MSRRIKHFYSERGIPLIHYRDHAESFSHVHSTLTVENYCKWYELYWINPDGKVEKVDCSWYEEFRTFTGKTAWADHVPNPEMLDFSADSVGASVCPESREMVIGRWETEINGKEY